MPQSIHRVALARRDEDENFLRNSSHPIVYPGSDEIIVSALTLLVGRQEGHPACKKRGVGMVICLERGADLHMFQLMPLPLTVSCFSKIQIGFSFLVPAHLGSPGERAVKRVCVVRDYPGRQVPEETFTHSHPSWSFYYTLNCMFKN